MVTLLAHYTDIINSLESIKYAQHKVTFNKTFNQAFAENIDELYRIATEMYNFKENGGNLQHDYGRGILINKFFDKICCSLPTVENIKRENLKKLDSKAGEKTNIYPFNAIEQEYSEYLLNQRYNNSEIQSPLRQLIIRKWGINIKYNDLDRNKNVQKENIIVNTHNSSNYSHSLLEENRKLEKKLAEVCI